MAKKARDVLKTSEAGSFLGDAVAFADEHQASFSPEVLRNVEGGSLAARSLYPSVRHEGPENLPRSPVIGTDAPVQYEERGDIGAPRKRLPTRRP